LSDPPDEILDRVASEIRNNPLCADRDVGAEVDVAEEDGEDESGLGATLRLTTTSLTGGQPIPGMRGSPGGATVTCFSSQGLGVPVQNQIQIMNLQLTTPPAGASGGTVRLTEVTNLGTCTLSVPTVAGQTAAQVAQALVAAQGAPGIPGPNPDCPAEV